MACPLCECEASRPSWVGTLVYKGREFPYVECAACRSLYCDPMPDDEVVAEMYGPQYGEEHTDGFACEDPKEPQRVVEWLRRNGRGTFVDYGCRDGALLSEAAALGWEAVGVELDPAVASRTAARTGLRVVTPSDELLSAPFADAVHLGDVVEHLTKMNEQLRAVLGLLRPGGVLLAQGPLEANANLFTWALKLGRRVRGARRVEMAPMHVLLATSRGQRRLFERFGLAEMEYDVHEASWPAPVSLSLADLRRPRALGLFVLRRSSQALSAARRGAWGNRYFYAGQMPAGQQQSFAEVAG